MAQGRLPRLRPDHLFVRGSRGPVDPVAGIGPGERALAVHLRGTGGLRVRDLVVREGRDAAANSEESTAPDAEQRNRPAACALITGGRANGFRQGLNRPGIRLTISRKVSW